MCYRGVLWRGGVYRSGLMVVVVVAWDVAIRYGSHYSTAVGTVLHYLLRLEPFTSQHVAFQDGHFDVPDRLFFSIPATYHMCTTSISEVKELIPEFFFLPDMFRNVSGYTFGVTQDGPTVVRGIRCWHRISFPHPRTSICVAGRSGMWSYRRGPMARPKSLFGCIARRWSHRMSPHTCTTG